MTKDIFNCFYCHLTIAINNTTDSYVGMEHFLGWDADDKVLQCIIILTNKEA